MTSILDLEIFARIVEAGNLSSAARSLDMTPAAVSISLKRLEARLGTRLIVRSTRSLRLTEEGRSYLESVRLALTALSNGELALKTQSSEFSGLLQISAPSDFGRNILLPWLDDFKKMHPNIRLQVFLGDLNTDLFRNPVDIALRYGTLADSDIIALPLLTEHRRVVCASPRYLQREGTPNTPNELSKHNALLYMRSGRPYNTWRFTRGDEVQEIQVDGNYLSDDGEIARRWALADHGIIYKAWLEVAQDLHEGRLITLLPGWQGEATPFNLLCPHRDQIPGQIASLHSFLRKRCLEFAMMAGIA